MSYYGESFEPWRPSPALDYDDEHDAWLDDDVPAWLVSVLLHMAVVVVLGSWMIPLPERPPAVVAVVSMPAEPEPLEPLQEFKFTPEESPDSGSPQVAGHDVALTVAPVLSEAAQLPPDQLARVEIAPLAATPTLLDIATAPNVDRQVRVRGQAGVGVVGALGAVDRITQEILLSLEERPTLVVWIFDESFSMRPQREAVHGRLDRVYRELGASQQLAVAGRRGPQPLLSSVLSFGEKVTFRLERPTDDVAAIKAAVQSIPDDPSGIELTFTAIGQAAERFQPFRQQGGRNVMLVLFTDEVGDDENRMEAATALCRRLAMPVYVVGTPAPFGRSEIEVKYVDPDPRYSQTPQWIPIRQGPESLAPETVQLAFSPTLGRTDWLDRLDSGFGPYCLTRICYETGGIFFAVHPSRTEAAGPAWSRDTAPMASRLSYFFDPLVMSAYQPDYLPIDEYQRRVMQNRAKWALVEASKLSRVAPMSAPRLVFPKGEGENAEAQFKQLLDVAQRDAAILEPRINAIYEVLRQGERDRPRLTEARWRAGYDLAMGRVLAVKVRTEVYNQMLAKAKLGLKFQDPKNNTFVLVPDAEVSTGSNMEKLARQAREYLQRVIDEHPGTPWALLAETELKEPIGWRWDEQFTPPPPPPPTRPPGNGNGNGQPQGPRMLPRPTAPVRPNIRL